MTGAQQEVTSVFTITACGQGAQPKEGTHHTSHHTMAIKISSGWFITGVLSSLITILESLGVGGWLVGVHTSWLSTFPLFSIIPHPLPRRFPVAGTRTK